MELRRQEKIKKLKYPEKASTCRQNGGNISKDVTVFSALLFSMLSNAPTYGAESNFNGPYPPIAGGLQVAPNYYVYSTIDMIYPGVLIIAIVSLITTIIFTAQMCKLKKKDNPKKDKLEEDVINVETDEKTSRLERIKKRLVISRIVLVSSIIIFIILIGIRAII